MCAKRMLAFAYGCAGWSEHLRAGLAVLVAQQSAMTLFYLESPVSVVLQLGKR